MSTLDGRQKKAMRAALRNAVPRASALERLVEFHRDEHLAVIVCKGAPDDALSARWWTGADVLRTLPADAAPTRCPEASAPITPAGNTPPR